MRDTKLSRQITRNTAVKTKLLRKYRHPPFHDFTPVLMVMVVSMLMLAIVMVAVSIVNTLH